MSVVVLAGPGESSFMVANYLAAHFDVDALVIERQPSRWGMLRRRAERLGWWTVSGQFLFILFSRVLARQSAARMAQIRAEHCLQEAPARNLKVLGVHSANDDATIHLLKDLAPRVVVVNGTRIISNRVLEQVGVPFINMHAGITPKYRGVHGGYWALACGDGRHAGVTVHLVDQGIDTGSVLYQAIIQPGPRDNFATYPLLQLAAGLPLLRRAVADALVAQLAPQSPDLPSALYYHPTLWRYLFHWLKDGVK